MKTFLSLTAILEGATGIALILTPQFIVQLLLSTPLDGNGGIIATRVAGIAITSLALGCWFSRNEKSSGILVSLLFYNFAIIAIFLDAFFVYSISGIFLWLVISAHIVFGVWGIIKMRKL